MKHMTSKTGNRDANHWSKNKNKKGSYMTWRDIDKKDSLYMFKIKNTSPQTYLCKLPLFEDFNSKKGFSFFFLNTWNFRLLFHVFQPDSIFGFGCDFFLFSWVFAILWDTLETVFWGVAIIKSTCYSFLWPYISVLLLFFMAGSCWYFC